MGEVGEWLEGAMSAGGGAEVWASARDGGLARLLLLYHAETGHARALELLARAPEPHARHLADAVLEELPRVLCVLPGLLARRPPALLPRLATPHVLRELCRLARAPATRTHALLAATVLCASAPAAIAPALPDLANALLHALPPADPHVALAARALFHALYATQPCALADALRDALAAREPVARERAERALTPLLEGARLHPLLMLRREPRRRLEAHDVPAELRRYEVEARSLEPPAPRSPPAPTPALPPPPSSRLAAPLRPGVEPWFGLAERAGADSAPNTPLPAEGGSPPEAAVEATPENTPAKEQRAAAQFHFPSESGAVRALGRLSQPPSPLRKESGSTALGGGGGGGGGMEARLARVVLERARAEPEPEPPPPDDEDVPAAWPVPASPRAPRRRPRRAASCPPARTHARDHAHTQTVDTHPPDYEFLFADIYRTIADPPMVREKEECAMTESELYARLDAYLTSKYSGGGEPSDLAAQLAMTHAHLMHERWRRDAHAERNRRLLGRCRAARAADLASRDLRDRLRALTAERDALRARVPPPPRADPAPSEPEPAAARAALQAERAARDRAEASLRDLEAQRHHDQLEARRARARAQDATRRADSLARAAALVERRGDLVAALRREIVVLGEREARLQEAVRVTASAGAGAAANTAALAAARADAGAARGEAEAARARAEALAARLAEAEAALGAREAALAAARKAAKASSAEAAARLDALQDKYRALMHVLRRMEARRLERSGGVGGARDPSPASSPLSASLASHASEPADCRRVRDLLDEGDA